MSFLKRRKKQGVAGFKSFVKTIETAPIKKQQDILLAAELDDAIYAAWAQRNLLTIDKILQMNPDDLQIVVDALPQSSTVCTKAFYDLPEKEEFFLEMLNKGQRRQYDDEKEYLHNVAPTERYGSQNILIKYVRQLQEDETIVGPPWDLPSLEIITEKKIDVSSGMWALKHENGKVSAKGEMINYERSGHWSHYFENGKLMAVGSYSLGKKTGPWIFFFETGEKRAEGRFVDDEKRGQWILYQLDGTSSIEDYE